MGYLSRLICSNAIALKSQINSKEQERPDLFEVLITKIDVFKAEGGVELTMKKQPEPHGLSSLLRVFKSAATQPCKQRLISTAAAAE